MEVIQCTCLNIPCNSQMAVHRANWSNSLDSLLVGHMYGVDTVLCNVTLGSLVRLDPQNGRNSKRGGHRVKKRLNLAPTCTTVVQHDVKLHGPFVFNLSVYDFP